MTDWAEHVTTFFGACGVIIIGYSVLYWTVPDAAVHTVSAICGIGFGVNLIVGSFRLWKKLRKDAW